MFVVFCSGMNESNVIDVDFFNSFGNVDIDFGDSVFEGVKVVDNEVNFVDVLVGKIFFVGSEVVGEDISMDGRVEGFDVVGKYFGGFGDGRDVFVKK